MQISASKSILNLMKSKYMLIGLKQWNAKLEEDLDLWINRICLSRVDESTGLIRTTSWLGGWEEQANSVINKLHFLLSIKVKKKKTIHGTVGKVCSYQINPLFTLIFVVAAFCRIAETLNYKGHFKTFKIELHFPNAWDNTIHAKFLPVILINDSNCRCQIKTSIYLLLNQ